MSESGVTIFHNPMCGTSRTTLQLIRDRGIEPKVVEYLKDGWTKPQLQHLLKRMRKAPRDILRSKQDLASELGLLDPSVSDDKILDAMVANPVLVERPIVESAKGVALGRPPESVLPVLPGA